MANVEVSNTQQRRDERMECVTITYSERFFSVGYPGWNGTLMAWVGDERIGRASWPMVDIPTSEGVLSPVPAVRRMVRMLGLRDGDSATIRIRSRRITRWL